METQYLLNKLKRHGYTVEYRKYKYWDKIPHVANTALCFDVITEQGGHTISTCVRQYPRWCYFNYIKKQIENGEHSLGIKCYKLSLKVPNNKNFYKNSEITLEMKKAIKYNVYCNILKEMERRNKNEKKS